MKVKFVKSSICDCGFPILDYAVPIGTLYEIHPDNKIPVIFECGGCKRRMQVSAVWVQASGARHGGYLPEEIFEPVRNEGKETP